MALVMSMLSLLSSLPGFFAYSAYFHSRLELNIMDTWVELILIYGSLDQAGM